MWLETSILISVTSAIIIAYKWRHTFQRLLKAKRQLDVATLVAQLAILEERTKYLQGLEEKIERIRDKQDSDARELRERLYSEYSKRLQESIGLLKDTFGRINETTANAFKEISEKSALVYEHTTEQLVNIANRLESAFRVLEQREHAQMREEIKSLKLKIEELERDPLKVQLQEIAEAQAAQALHEDSVKKVTTAFWRNNGEVRFKERIGQYQPDVYINNHRIKIVADEVTTNDAETIKAKVKRVAEYMHGLNANVGYVIIPNAGVDAEVLREIKRTVPERGLYVVRLTEYAIHLQVWYDIAMTGLIDIGSLVEKGYNFLQILEPIFEEFLAIVQNLEQRDEKDFKYRQNRYKELKSFPSRILDVIERQGARTPSKPVQTKIAEYDELKRENE
ncbi:MAG: hypothetical protein QXW82_06560 [Candidatus Bathyarchaeia archaeon]